MTTLDTQRRGATTRRSGYVSAALINGILLFLINVQPGWSILPFLTPQMNDVVPVIDLALFVSIAANLVYLAADLAWVRNIGDIVTTAVGIAAMWRLWTVYPFDFPNGFNWDLLAHVLLGIGLAGSAIAVLVALWRLATGRRP